jgi:sugar lactone lactonase YvrE
VTGLTERREVRVALAAEDHLGEGPHWDDATQELLRVDITRGLVHRWRPGTPAGSVTAFEGEASAVLPRRDGGFVVAVGRALVLVDPDGRRRPLARVEDDRPHNRFNDCRCDPQGRLWAGTMSTIREPGTAALYRVTAGEEIEKVIGETTLSNGMGWSPSGDRMYFIDTATQRIESFVFDGTDGTVRGRGTFAEIAPDDGLPDGMAIDADGGVWVCLFGGAAVRRYDPSGHLDVELRLSVSNPTCPVFGGADLRTLFITTARHGLSARQLQSEPLAGSVLAVDPGIAGLPGNRFAG